MERYCEFINFNLDSEASEPEGEECGKIAHFERGDMSLCAEHYDKIMEIEAMFSPGELEEVINEIDRAIRETTAARILAAKRI